jgi:hypothetical protein
MRMAMCLAVMLALTGGGAARAEVDLAGMVSSLQAIDPVVAGELAFLTGDPAVVAPRIAAFAEARAVSQAALDALSVVEDAHFTAMDSYRGRTVAQIEAEIAGLDPAAADREATLARLEEARGAALLHEETLRGLGARVAEAQSVYSTAQTAEDAALLVLTEGMMISAEARRALWGLMGY